jgi:hypothetical protein
MAARILIESCKQLIGSDTTFLPFRPSFSIANVYRLYSRLVAANYTLVPHPRPETKNEALDAPRSLSVRPEVRCRI